MAVCPHCGHDTADVEARFCPVCGRPLTAVEGASESTSALALGVDPASAESVELTGEQSPVDPAVLERLAPGTALLVVRRGPASGARFLLDADVTTTGRHPDSDIFLDDITVSRHHAEFRRDGEKFRVVDSGSLNGTFVNRSRIEDVELNGGDEVQIGKYRLVFLAGGQA